MFTVSAGSVPTDEDTHEKGDMLNAPLSSELRGDILLLIRLLFINDKTLINNNFNIVEFQQY